MFWLQNITTSKIAARIELKIRICRKSVSANFIIHQTQLPVKYIQDSDRCSNSSNLTLHQLCPENLIFVNLSNSVLLSSKVLWYLETKSSQVAIFLNSRESKFWDFILFHRFPHGTILHGSWAYCISRKTFRISYRCSRMHCKFNRQSFMKFIELENTFMIKFDWNLKFKVFWCPNSHWTQFKNSGWSQIHFHNPSRLLSSCT